MLLVDTLSVGKEPNTLDLFLFFFFFFFFFLLACLSENCRLESTRVIGEVVSFND